MSTRTTRIRTLAAAGLVAVSLGAAAVPAGAATSAVTGAKPTRAVAAKKAKCNYEIDRRLFTLTISKNWISDARRLTDDQRTSLIAGIDGVMTNLTTVNRPALQAATTRDAVNLACQAIYADNRVYAVIIPQLLLTVRADQLAAGHDLLVTKSAEKAAAGADTTALDALLASAQAKITAAQAAVTSVSPSSFNADPTGTKAILDQAAADLQSAAGDLLGALQALKALG